MPKRTISNDLFREIHIFFTVVGRSKEFLFLLNSGCRRSNISDFISVGESRNGELSWEGGGVELLGVTSIEHVYLSLNGRGDRHREKIFCNIYNNLMLLCL